MIYELPLIISRSHVVSIYINIQFRKAFKNAKYLFDIEFLEDFCDLVTAINKPKIYESFDIIVIIYLISNLEQARGF